MSTLSGGPNIVTDGLVLWLDAANTKSYVSGSATWNDISRGGNNGTLINGPIFNTGSGGSIVFDGNNDYGIIPQNTAFDFNTFTCAAWIRTPTNGRCISFIGGALSGYKYYFGIHTNNALRINYDNVAAINGTINVATNNWVYVTITYSSPTTVLYVNGTADLTSTAMSGSLKTLNGATYMGSTLGNTEFFSGSISQTSIYNRALTSQEVLQNYNSLKSRFNLT
jgi:hypothetical protein